MQAIGFISPFYQQCVRQDTVRQGSFGSNSVWDDKKSGAKANLSVWEIRSSIVWAADGETETTDGQKVGDGGLAVTTYLGPIRESQDYDAPDSSFAHVPLASIADLGRDVQEGMY
ncbi:hypothetical protein TGAM01_v206431 [Trichoderma gamsii]|uniref:Uncharacterized protein n=1 Tax=Trichoderma gamsii TaxID=398673 RepID=A0A2P4ZJM3_9HYPO|nr:hypothetical protein TGAM01_v206431 [Trichoderma gamsii]PON24501.1 hypothetical protein TGAM01_v206431 [Trichoderma gamsii]